MLDIETENPDKEVICLMRKKNYKVSLSLGTSPSRSVPLKGVLDTGAGPNSVHVKALPPGWEKFACPYKASLRIIDASNNPLSPLPISPYMSESEIP